MPPGYLGTETLVSKLTKILFKQIKNFLPEIIKEINLKIKECEEGIQLLGQPLPIDNTGKLNLLWNMMSEYCETYKNVLKGKYDMKRHSYIKDEGGYKVKAMYKDLLTDFTGDYKATSNYY
jgi:dynamin 1-like protein